LQLALQRGVALAQAAADRVGVGAIGAGEGVVVGFDPGDQTTVAA